MLQVSKIIAVVALGIAFFASWTPRPAEAACQLIKATRSAGSQAEAAEMSRALALQSANDVKRAKGWNNVSLTARKVKGDPFWKAVRPDGVPDRCSIEAGHRHFALLHHLLHRGGRALRLHDRLKRLRTIRSKLTHPYRGGPGEPLARVERASAEATLELSLAEARSERGYTFFTANFPKLRARAHPGPRPYCFCSCFIL